MLFCFLDEVNQSRSLEGWPLEDKLFNLMIVSRDSQHRSFYVDLVVVEKF